MECPRVCPEGSLTPWVSVCCVGRLSVCGRSRNRRKSGRHVRAERNPDLPDNLVPLEREVLVPALHVFRTRVMRTGAACDRTCFRGARGVDNRRYIGCAGHHAIDARSVLGTVQGSSLRSARASARPAGLDGTCAHIASGNYVMAGDECRDRRIGARDLRLDPGDA